MAKSYSLSTGSSQEFSPSTAIREHDSGNDFDREQRSIAPERTSGGATIKKNKNTFAKLQRERQKKRKADEKRQRRLERKSGDTQSATEPTDESDDQGDEVVAIDQADASS